MSDNPLEDLAAAADPGLDWQNALELRVVDDDTACVDCGYNLRGLPYDHFCPECGALVERSTHGHLLIFANPKWLKGVSQGLHWVVGAFLLEALGYIILISGVSTRSIYLLFGFVVVTISAAYMLWHGVFLATAPEPHRVHNENPAALRRVARIAAIVTGAVFAANVARLILPRLYGVDTPRWFHEALLWSQLSVVVMFFSGFAYLRRLALRVPDRDLARSTTLMIGLVTVLGVVFIGSVIIASGPERPIAHLILLAMLSGFALLGTLIWAVLLVNVYARTFADARRMSKWAMRNEPWHEQA